jgi:hypothetical protein
VIRGVVFPSVQLKTVTIPIVVLLGAAMAAGAWAVAVMRRGQATPEPDRIAAAIAATRLRFDPAYARFGDGRRGGRLERLDVAARLPAPRYVFDAAPSHNIQPVRKIRRRS